jgi:Putative TM nitroreductase
MNLARADRPASGLQEAGMQRPIPELINARYSCRTYRDEPVAADVRRELAEFVAAHTAGPFGSQARFAVVAATPDDPRALRRLGTYGFIKGATGFLVGAVARAPKDLEDYGYLAEQAVLFATGLGLGTCWLGGTFTKGTFAARLGGLQTDEIMPAVVSLGYPADDGAERIRQREAGSRRLPASSLFFADRLGEPLTFGGALMLDEVPVSGDVHAPGDVGMPGTARTDGDAETFAAVLEGVRMAPSASNKQPWRIVRRGADWHFYLQRTKGYGKGSPVFRLLRLTDLQRVDLGIALCHFELAAREAGLSGEWMLDEPDIGPLPPGMHYTATWRGSPA